MTSNPNIRVCDTCMHTLPSERNSFAHAADYIHREWNDLAGFFLAPTDFLTEKPDLAALAGRPVLPDLASLTVSPITEPLDASKDISLPFLWTEKRMDVLLRGVFSSCEIYFPLCKGYSEYAHYIDITRGDVNQQIAIDVYFVHKINNKGSNVSIRAVISDEEESEEERDQPLFQLAYANNDL